jgi:flavin reductase (DIM6/NTAB) family NADH-FMN oxidoreductase RutF
MAKKDFKPGNMLYPVPVALITCGDFDGESNVLTIAWTGTICSDPAMVSISVRPERHSYGMIKKNMEFVINLVNEKLTRATDYCGVKSGKDVDKFKESSLTKERATVVKAPLIAQSPVNIECRVRQIIPLGSHDMFLADVVAVHVDDKYIDEKGKFCFESTEPVVYSHGEYYGLGRLIGNFGYSVKKK